MFGFWFIKKPRSLMRILTNIRSRWWSCGRRGLHEGSSWCNFGDRHLWSIWRHHFPIIIVFIGYRFWSKKSCAYVKCYTPPPHTHTRTHTHSNIYYVQSHLQEQTLQGTSTLSVIKRCWTNSGLVFVGNEKTQFEITALGCHFKKLVCILYQ